MAAAILCACHANPVGVDSPNGSLTVSLTTRGSGAAGRGLSVAIGSGFARVFAGESIQYSVEPGNHAVSLLDSDEWCQVDTLPESISIQTGRLVELALTAHCVGGIAYEETRGGLTQIRMIRPDGLDQQISQFPMGAHTLESWAPDGRQLAVRSVDRLRLWDTETETVTELPFNGQPHSSITWSPDDEWVAYTSGHNPEIDGRIVVVRRSGQGQRLLFPDTDGADAEPSWSPDGQSIAFGSWRSGRNRSIHVAGIDGSGLSRLHDGFNQSPRWSPDGRWLAFVAFEDQIRVHVTRPDRSGAIALQASASQWSPRWSPSENMVAIGVGQWHGSVRLDTYDADTGERRTLVDLEGGIRDFAWSGDGEWLVFSYPSPTGWQLRIVRKDGTGMRTIRSSTHLLGAVLWDPRLTN